jgi:hypothetical protein
MNGLTKRVEAMERETDIQEKHFAWVEYASDGGLVHEGVWYADADALAGSLGYDPDTVLVAGWTPTVAKHLESLR